VLASFNFIGAILNVSLAKALRLQKPTPPYASADHGYIIAAVRVSDAKYILGKLRL